MNEFNPRKATDVLTSTLANTADLKHGDRLDIKAVQKAMKILKSSEEMNKKHLVRMLSGMGFIVMPSELNTKPCVMLPKEYKDAIMEVVRENNGDPKKT